MFVIRRMEEGDVSQIAEIELESPSAWSVDQIKSELFIPAGITLVVAKNNSCIGWCCGRITGDEAELFKIAVSSEFKRQGLASELFMKFQTVLKERAVRKLFLEVRAENNEALSFYHHHGMKSVGKRINYYREPTDDAVVMEMLLW